MYKCTKNSLGSDRESSLEPERSDKQRVLDDPSDLERVSLRTKLGPVAKKGEDGVEGGRGEVEEGEDGVEGGSGEVEERCVVDARIGVGTVSEDKARGKRKGRKGELKGTWSHDEVRVLWECYVRSNPGGRSGYMKRMKEMWD